MTPGCHRERLLNLMSMITENTQIDTPSVVSVFDFRKRRYDRAIEKFNEWFLSGARCKGDYVDSVFNDLVLLDAIVEVKNKLFATPANTLIDVLFKIEQSRDDLDEIVGDDCAVALLDSAIAALQANNTAEAIRAIERAIDAADDFMEGATAALDDLRRMFAESLS